MAEDRFDKILKETLEGYEPNISPSAAEVDRLLLNSPLASPGLLTTYGSIAATVLILLLTISNLYYLVKVNWLEEDIAFLKQHHSVNQSVFYDTLKTHSSRKERIILNGTTNDDGIPEGSYDSGDQANDHFSNILLDEQRAASLNENSTDEEIVASVINVIESNPEVAKHIIRTILNDSKFNEQIEMIVVEKNGDNLIKKEYSGLDKSDQSNEILLIAGNDLSDEVSGDQPTLIDTDDQIISSDSTNYESENPDEQTLIGELSESKDNGDSRTDSLSFTPRRLRSDVIPANKRPKVSYNLEAGIGLNMGELSNGISQTFPDLSVRGEAMIGEHFAFLAGLGISNINYEEKGELTLDENIVTNLSDDQISSINELKVDVLIVNLPLETRYYFMPIGKFQPYLETGLLARYIASESLNAEIIDNNQEMTLPISTSTEVPKFSVSSYRIGAGSRFGISRKLSGGVSLSYLKGIKNINSLDQKLDNLQVKFMLVHSLN